MIAYSYYDDRKMVFSKPFYDPFMLVNHKLFYKINRLKQRLYVLSIIKTMPDENI